MNPASKGGGLKAGKEVKSSVEGRKARNKRARNKRIRERQGR